MRVTSVQGCRVSRAPGNSLWYIPLSLSQSTEVREVLCAQGCYSVCELTTYQNPPWTLQLREGGGGE